MEQGENGVLLDGGQEEKGQESQLEGERQNATTRWNYEERIQVFLPKEGTHEEGLHQIPTVASKERI
ncbi:hypothetical protein Scep_016021 [Stephania cephalantha]|uniref:Uncharacterized protein n=1 Tax=Stephania cephalantha TaxID=152367 RepID=A0AAP0ILU2_9MAGN